MFINAMTISQPNGAAMPISSTIARDIVMSVRDLPVTTGVVSLPAGKQRVEGTRVCGYRHIADDVAVVTGAFLGTSAWSPPI